MSSRRIQEYDFNSHLNNQIDGQPQGFEAVVGRDATTIAREDHGVVKYQLPPVPMPTFDTLPVVQLRPTAEATPVPATSKEPRHLAKAKFGYGAIKAVKGLIR